MEKVINITMNNIYSFVNELEYGTNHIITESELVFNRFNHILSVYEQSAGFLLFRTNGDMQIDPEGVFGVTLIFTERNFSFQELHPDNFNLDLIVKEAKTSKSIVTANIDESMIKTAGKLSKLNGVGFHDTGKGYFEFNGMEKNKPVSTQIMEAFRSGESSISFDLNKNTSTTLRCYASTIGGSYGRKFKCVAKDGILTIWFKEMDPVDRLRLEIKNIENKFIDLVSADDFKNVLAEKLYELTGHTFIPLQPKKGFADFETDILDTIADRYDMTKEDLIMDVDFEENQPEERDYEAEAESARLLPDAINQEYIKNLYEDDDF